ncbi:MAG: hypothetical protein ACLU9S_02890 [Oscillospiraceae bacterium]
MVIDTLQKVRTGDANGNVYACDYRDMSTLKSLADRTQHRHPAGAPPAQGPDRRSLR